VLDRRELLFDLIVACLLFVSQSVVEQIEFPGPLGERAAKVRALELGTQELAPEPFDPNPDDVELGSGDADRFFQPP